MATQSLYRRYRPRRFSEVKGQEHVVRALRNAVINHREGQAYLFSGPRGTGKTSSARILAKVLNCENPQDGEPCCVCESCVAVERGTSYDVHELDAASNNGVDAMRDLIEKASLGTPGRHKVYILDEVHMLSKAAEAALLKTLEEPPPHVVFVLATTDPQKVSETVRSRTQHLQFHLLPVDVMEDHIRWLAGDAGIDLSDEALQSVLRQGGGSARDTVSALELVAAGGGSAVESIPLDEFIEALIEHDSGRALTVVAHAMQQGRDARTVTDDIVRHLRDCFLSLMAPELVQLPAQRADEVAALASRLGAASIVRAMEKLGEMLVEMRHAPDQRLLLEVALVQLTHDAAGADVGVLIERIERLEHQLASGAAAPQSRPAPVDPNTGRAAIGGRAKREPAADRSQAPSPSPSPPASTEPPTLTAVPDPVEPGAAPVADAAVADDARAVTRAVDEWASQVMPAMKSLPRAIFAATKLLGERDGAVALGAPNEAHRAKCQQHLAEAEAAVAKVVGSRVPVVVTVHEGAAHDDNVIPLVPQAPPPTPDDEVDLTELVDAPPDSVVTPTDRLLQAFPGSQLIEE
ncbi:MAG TPA: DNA polymerase III subunit gamma/tau [Ilumatobacteraceae bacterium]|nr:DNA polymerase III subunit gamma/tau [Ilumatobacteraceae bacterium]